MAVISHLLILLVIYDRDPEKVHCDGSEKHHEHCRHDDLCPESHGICRIGISHASSYDFYNASVSYHKAESIAGNAALGNPCEQALNFPENRIRQGKNAAPPLNTVYLCDVRFL